MNGVQEPDPLLELWLRTRDALAPFGIAVGTEVLALWRDQQTHGRGPLMRAAMSGERRQVDELIELLHGLVGDDVRGELPARVAPGR